MGLRRGSGLRRCGYVAERKVGLEVFHLLAVDFRVGVDEIVERIAFLIRGQADVAAVGKENAVNIVGAEEIIVLGGIFPGFRGVYGNPSRAVEIKLGPAVVAGDV